MIPKILHRVCTRYGLESAATRLVFRMQEDQVPVKVIYDTANSLLGDQNYMKLLYPNKETFKKVKKYLDENKFLYHQSVTELGWMIILED